MTSMRDTFPIRVEYGHNESEVSSLSKIKRMSSQHIRYDDGEMIRRPYKQREGERTTPNAGGGGLGLLTDDYPMYVEESKTLDCQLTAFEAYEQIYGAFN